MAEPLGDDGQQTVAGVVAEPFVDRAEAVEIDGENGGAQAVVPCLGEGRRQPLEEERAIGEPGEHVAGRWRVEPSQVATAADGETNAAIEPAGVAFLLVEEVGDPGLDRGVLHLLVSALAEQDDRPLEAAAKCYVDEVEP